MSSIILGRLPFFTQNVCSYKASATEEREENRNPERQREDFISVTWTFLLLMWPEHYRKSSHDLRLKYILTVYSGGIVDLHLLLFQCF